MLTVSNGIDKPGCHYRYAFARVRANEKQTAGMKEI
jgi:hypothetical protein